MRAGEPSSTAVFADILEGSRWHRYFDLVDVVLLLKEVATDAGSEAVSSGCICMVGAQWL